MAVWIFAVAFIFFCGSDSFAQVYKYKDKNGNIVFTDNPSGMVKGGGAPKEEKSKEEMIPKKRSSAPVKDVNQFGEEMLAQELAKPPGKQDKRLIQELHGNFIRRCVRKEAPDHQRSRVEGVQSFRQNPGAFNEKTIKPADFRRGVFILRMEKGRPLKTGLPFTFFLSIPKDLCALCG